MSSGPVTGGKVHADPPALVLVPLWAVRDRRAVVAGPTDILEAVGYDAHGVRHVLLLDRGTCEVRINGTASPFGLREFLVLEALIQERGRTLRSHDLLRILDSVLTERGGHATPWTLRHCISSLRAHLGPVFAEHVVSEHRRGYVWRDDATAP